MIFDALLVEKVDVRVNDTSKLLEADFHCRAQERVVSLVAREASPEVIGVTEDVIPLVISIADTSLEGLISPPRSLAQLSEEELANCRSCLEIRNTYL